MITVLNQLPELTEHIYNTISNESYFHFPKGEFVDDGTETHFDLGGHPAYIKAVSSGNRREGIIHSLVVDNTEIPESLE